MSILLFAFGRSVKDALMALKKVEARCQTGIAYRDYASTPGEAKQSTI
jgi:hypothetical protein